MGSWGWGEWFFIGDWALEYDWRFGGGTNREGSGASYSPILDDVIKSVVALGLLLLGEKVWRLLGSWPILE